MADVLLFGGTTEGRELAGFLEAEGISSLVSVATSYGKMVLPEDIYSHVSVRNGRLNQLEIEDLIKKEQAVLVIDATHPFAKEATKQIREACSHTNARYIRCLREEIGREEDFKQQENVIWFSSLEEIADWLSEPVRNEGNILVSTGSKELAVFTRIPDYEKRIYARVLPIPSVLESCQSLGFMSDHIIGMQGPFSVRMNQVMLEEFSCRYLVTKESGKTGGLEEKLAAAQAADAVVLGVLRPKEEGYSLKETKDLIKQIMENRL